MCTHSIIYGVYRDDNWKNIFLQQLRNKVAVFHFCENKMCEKYSGVNGKRASIVQGAKRLPMKSVQVIKHMIAWSINVYCVYGCSIYVYWVYGWRMFHLCILCLWMEDGPSMYTGSMVMSFNYPRR